MSSNIASNVFLSGKVRGPIRLGLPAESKPATRCEIPAVLKQSTRPKARCVRWLARSNRVKYLWWFAQFLMERLFWLALD